MIKIASAGVFFNSRRHDQRGELDEHPDDEPADQSSERRAEATERDAREHQEQQAGTHVEPDLLVERPEDAAQSGQRAGEDPDHPDHTLAVDARRRGEVRVVGDRPRRLPQPGLLQRQGDRDQHHERNGGRDHVAWCDRDRTDVGAFLQASSRGAAVFAP